jgi:hypothetical protein
MIKSVLVVDDDNICNFLTVKALKKASIKGNIDVVLNGLEAINRLKENNTFPRFNSFRYKHACYGWYRFSKEL